MQMKLASLQSRVKLILAQDQGCGGNLKEEEVLEAMRRELFGLLSELSVKPRETTLVFCKNCGGEGCTTREELTDYHRRDYMTIIKPCKVCGETGRLRQIVFTVHEPFVPHK